MKWILIVCITSITVKVSFTINNLSKYVLLAVIYFQHNVATEALLANGDTEDDVLYLFLREENDISTETAR
jgi:hypothetical protein